MKLRRIVDRQNAKSRLVSSSARLKEKYLRVLAARDIINITLYTIGSRFYVCVCKQRYSYVTRGAIILI